MNAETNPFELRAGTLDTNALQVLSFHGRERINDVYSYEVVFATSLEPKSLVAAFGGAAALTLKTSEQPPRILQGIAAHLEALGGVPGERATGRRRYSLTIVPKLWLLKQRRKNRVFQDKTAKEIVESLLRGIGLTSEDWRWRTQPDYPKIPFVYQRNESDYEFFRRMLASAGIFFYFEHPSKDGTVTKLNFGDAAGHTVAVQGSLRFDDGTGADAREERIYEFGLKKRLRPKTLLMLDRDVEKATNWARVATTKSNSGPVFDADTTKITPDILREDVYQVDNALRVGPDSEMDTELERLRSGCLEARGRSDCRQLAPGYRFQLGSHPIDALNDTYTVTVLDSEGIHPAFMSKGDASHVYRNRFRCIPSRFSPRPLRSPKRPKMGLEVAKVVGEEGKLIAPTVEANHCGYVRIRFRWDIADDKGTPKESYGVNEDADHVVRLPVVQPWAGAGYGTQFIPRQGMEVLVGFLEHQGERPIILGCISSEENMPPWSGGENDFQKVGIHSRTWPPGDASAWSEISIDDRKDGELIYVQAQKDKTVYVKHDRTETVDNNEDITIHQNRTERVDHNETISIGVNRTESVGLNETISIGVNRTKSVGLMETLNVGMLQMETVGLANIDSVGMMRMSSVGVLYNLNVGQAMTTMVGKNQDTTVGNKYTLTVGGKDGASNVTMDPKSITLQVGKSKIVMQTDGTIAVNGEKITVAGTKQVDVLGDNRVRVSSSGSLLKLESEATLQGSKVHLKSGSGIACSTCPGGTSVGSPVNPQLGAKVLLGEEDMDFGPPGAMPVVWQRQYSSYVNAEHGSPCGLLGHGWHLLTEYHLELKDNAALLFDTAGRVITFEGALGPGEQQYSASEDIWLLRGGRDAQGYTPAWSRQERFALVSADLAGDEQCILVADGRAEFLLVFAPVAGRCWRLSAQVDRFGRSQRYQYSNSSESDGQHDFLPTGRLVGITDGVGRSFRLQHQRIHAGRPALGPWATDDGWRLVAVQLERDPLHPLPEPMTVVRYGYNQDGQLVTVHDRAGELAREFEWKNHRISAHRFRGGPWHRYRYAGEEPTVKVIEHTNEEGLGYQFQYHSEPSSPEGKPRNATIVTDSLGRTETYRFEGAAGLSRLIEHHRADGSMVRNRYDGDGRLMSSTDPLGRTTRFHRDAQGNPTGVELPGRISSAQDFDEAGRLVSRTDPTGAVTRYRYDRYQRLTEVEQADGSVERYRYPDPREQPLICDRPTEIEDAKGGVMRLRYNEAGQVVSHTDSSGHTDSRAYDRCGHAIAVTDPLGNTTRHERDPMGRITATQLPNGQIQRYRYDRQGNLVRVEPDENTLGSVQEIIRDLWGRPVRTVQGGLTILQDWDVAGRLTTLTNENGAQARFVWDTMDRMVEEIGFDGRVQGYRYDAAGQLVQTSDGNTVSRYRWDEAGRQIERQVPATEAAPAQSERYERDNVGRLKVASVYLIMQGQEQLQSRIEIERDVVGRITEEVQRLYQTEGMPTTTPPIEYEHRIAHRLDPMGNRQESSLQGVGDIQWLLHGSGHVHGLTHSGAELVGFERDALHREVKRHLHGVQGGADLYINRRRDNLGRLESIGLLNLPLQGIHAVPQILVGQITHRQYRYDALDQLTAIEMPNKALHYGYDAAGRLRTQTDSGQRVQRWEVDPAGNRIPGKQWLQGPQDWGDRMPRRWKDPYFNLLGQGNKPAEYQGPIDKWQGNRIGLYQDSAWRYDGQGNRVEQIRQDTDGDCSRQRLSYDGANQLTELCIAGVDSWGNDFMLSESRYVYDALGRRLKKTVKDQNGKEHVSYFGWDGDWLVHTERLKEDSTRDIVHTIYEPGTFTPMVRLSTTAKGVPQAKSHLLLQAVQAAMPLGKGNDSSTLDTIMQNMLAEMPGQRLTPQATAILDNMGVDASDLVVDERERLEGAKQEENTQITVHYYHCDHLGTPLALTDRQGQIVWAARLDPWGNLEDEFNPHNIEQNIRLPGQHHDRETGLYYNRHRYYDPKIGSYVNQDPIGLKGGWNQYIYANSKPIQAIDPYGLDFAPTWGEAAKIVAAEEVVLGGPEDPAADVLAVLTIVVLGAMILCRGRQWTCSSSCNVEGTAPHCTGRVTGSGSGPMEYDACLAAKRDATQSAPRGCYARHCQCRCSK
ncbi:MAG: type VI secretion system tip protein VgrG [Polyangiaceae bacterium]|nr:type VI secretion system tip protein VgrG [Polyangiaceae bacterium]